MAETNCDNYAANLFSSLNLLQYEHVSGKIHRGCLAKDVIDKTLFDNIKNWCYDFFISYNLQFTNT